MRVCGGMCCSIFRISLAQTDEALDITGQLGVASDQAISSSPFPASTQAEDTDSSDDADAIIFPSIDDRLDNNTDTDTNTVSETSRNVPSVNLSNKDPKGVMLATLESIPKPEVC